jgi:Asp-tRNA(Asn)/Glu-tRNA(Gln) amidotransferase C subunit
LDETKDEIAELAEMSYDPFTDQKSHMFTMDQKDITREIENLEKLSKIDIKKSKINPIDRSSTVRIEREKSQKVDWNMVVNWGEEWKLYDGGIYPETTLTLEGDLIIDEKDFEECLNPQEMDILRKLEVGEALDNIQEDDDDEF